MNCRKKTIIINGRFFEHRISGVERYAREILDEIDKMFLKDEIIIAIPPSVTDIPDYKRINIKKIGKLNKHLWEQISFPLYVYKKHGIAVNLCNSSPLISPGVVCIHDAKVKARPRDYGVVFLVWYRLLLFNACKRAKRIITVSEFSKRELSKYYNVNRDKIAVIPNAWQHFDRIKYNENVINSYGLTKNHYIFSLGSLEPNKNFHWIIEAAKANPSITFAVSGASNKRVFAGDVITEWPSNIIKLGYVTDEEAKTLMRDCKAFLFPSFYEGFGIPPLEALSAGCKRIMVSDIDVMHEIFGDCVLYISPYDIAGFESNLVKNSRVDVHEVLSKFDWAKSARKLIELLNYIGDQL